MSRVKKPALTPNQQEFKRALAHIRRLGYAAPEEPTSINKKALTKIHQVEQEAEQAHKAYRQAKARQAYAVKQGIGSSITIERGKSAEEYAKYTSSFFRAEGERAAKAAHPEAVQPYENRYQSTIDIIVQIDNELSKMSGMAPWGKRNQQLADRKNRMLSVIKDYWFDIVDTSDYDALVKLAARVEGKAELLQELITRRMYDSKSTEAEDAGTVSQILEILTGAKLSRYDEAIINDELDSGMFDDYD